jgi:hypothetical protein
VDTGNLQQGAQRGLALFISASNDRLDVINAANIFAYLKEYKGILESAKIVSKKIPRISKAHAKSGSK